jgi:hypothetical protein
VGSARKVMELPLQWQGDEIVITEEVVKESACNPDGQRDAGIPTLEGSSATNHGRRCQRSCMQPS